MACTNCGGEHPERTPADVAWGDQFRAEFRDRARVYYSQILAQAGIAVLLTEEQIQGVDRMFELGGTVMLDMLDDRGAIDREALR